MMDNEVMKRKVRKEKAKRDCISSGLPGTSELTPRHGAENGFPGSDTCWLKALRSDVLIWNFLELPGESK